MMDQMTLVDLLRCGTAKTSPSEFTSLIARRPCTCPCLSISSEPRHESGESDDEWIQRLRAMIWHSYGDK